MLKVYQKANAYGLGKGGGHIEGLDGLRTLAIVGVTLFHMFPEAVPGGYMGVSLFFVLSGYLLAYTCSRQLAQGSFSVAGYFWRRIKRIYPSLLLVLLVSTGAYYLLVPDVVAAVRPEVVSVLLGYNNWWQIAQNADYFTRLINTSPFTHLWFMGIELQYYLLWPVLFFFYAVLQSFFGTRAALLFMAVLGLASACVMPLSYVPGDDVTRLYYGTDMRIYALLFGAVMGLQRAEAGPHVMKSELLRKISCAAFVGMLAITIIAYFTLDGQNPLVYQGGMLAMTLLFCLLLRLTEDRGLPFGALLDMQGFRWIGKRSYGIFLWQYPVILLFSCMGWDKMPGWYFLEVALILLLAVWSDAVTDCLLSRELPFRAKPMAMVRVACFVVLSMCSMLVMGYGCCGIAASAESKASAVAELQAQLAEEEAEQARQNELAAEQAKAARIEAAKGQIDLSGAVCIGDSVMLGSVLAGTDESPGEKIYANGRQYVVYRGMGSMAALKNGKGSRARYFQDGEAEEDLVPQGIEGMVPYCGKVKSIMTQFCGGLKASLGYCGSRTIAELQDKGRFYRVTAAGQREARPHDITITKEAPNYRA